MDVTIAVYKKTSDLPISEKFGLLSQIRRCAVSIPSNIAEGAGRNSPGEFKQFLGIANGSTFELQTQLLILNRLNYMDDINNEILFNELEEIQKMLFVLMKSVN